MSDDSDMAWGTQDYPVGGTNVRPDLEPKLIKAAREEQQLVDALVAEGVTGARTKGDKCKNRKYGDIQFEMNGKPCSLELQCAQPGRKNYSLTLNKVSKFLGQNKDGTNCYHMFGNAEVRKFMVLSKDSVDRIIEEYDGSNKDLIVLMTDTYAVLSPAGLAATGECLGFGETIEECTADFLRNLRAQN